MPAGTCKAERGEVFGHGASPPTGSAASAAVRVNVVAALVS